MTSTVTPQDKPWLFRSAGPNPTIDLPDDRVGIVITRRNGDQHIAVVDQQHYGIIAPYRWTVMISKRNRGRVYAHTNKTINGKRKFTLMHTLVLADPLGRDCDHIDRDGLNNTLKNLRPADSSQNSCNRGKTRRNRSGYKGIWWQADHGVYRAGITVQRKTIGLGSYPDALSAALAYDEACRFYHGSFACPNFPDAGSIQ